MTSRRLRKQGIIPGLPPPHGPVGRGFTLPRPKRVHPAQDYVASGLADAKVGLGFLTTKRVYRGSDVCHCGHTFLKHRRGHHLLLEHRRGGYGHCVHCFCERFHYKPTDNSGSCTTCLPSHLG
jgi:hypothetical protein